MGKYDDAIGGGKIILDVEEVLNEESAKKVDERIKKQKAELEKPIEVEIKTDRAVKRLEELTKAANQVKSDLQEALSSKKSFEDINELVSKYETLKKNIKALTPNIDKNNASLKESNKALKDTKKLIDQLSVSQEKLNKTKKNKSIDSTVKQVDASKDLVSSTEQAINAQEKQTKIIKEQVKVTEKLAVAQEKATNEQAKYMYHAGKFRDNGRKSESLGSLYPGRSTGFYGTGTYGVDSSHIKEISTGQYGKKPMSIIDTSSYNLYNATTDKVASLLHLFLQQLTDKIYGSKGSKRINALYSDFNKLFPDNTIITTYDEFKRVVEEIATYVSQNKGRYPQMYDLDSAPTMFMKKLGYEGINTLGTSHANTTYGTVIYDLKEESIICKEITDELQKQQILEGNISEVIALNSKKKQEEADATKKPVQEQERAIKKQERLTAAVEETVQARQEDAKITVRTIEQVNAELEQEKQKLQEINSEIERNNNAFQNLYDKKRNYGKVVFETDSAVYDTEILSLASKELKEFNDLLLTRNKFQEKYIKLRDIISRYYVGERMEDYTIDRGLYKDMDQYISENHDMRLLDKFFQQGQKTTNKETNELFKNIVGELQSDGATVSRLLSSGEVYGAQIRRELNSEETNLNQTNQRLLAEREAQLTKINALRQEELDLTTKAGQEEIKNTQIAKTKSRYYEIDEKAAKLSKQMRSFDDYKAGSATASYRSAIDEIAKIVEEKKAQFPDQSDKLDELFDRYARNLATFINRDNQIGAQYPSVMISGAGNYNTKKHNRQMASWGKNYQYYDEKVLPIESRIRSFGSTGTIAIRNDESDALEKLEAKLEYMKYWHEIMVEVNKYYRKNKTLEGFEGVGSDELERIKNDLAIIKQVGMYDVPYPQYALSNDNQNINRIEGRIAELKRLKENKGLQENNDIYKLWTDKQDMRIRISFEVGKPDQEIIDMLKGKSFKWSPKNKAWQRQLTDNAVYDTKRLQEDLHEFYGITSVPDTQSNIPAVEKVQSLITDLANKYGESSFSNIFGETVAQFGELNASNAIELYDVLIAKEKEYIAQCEREAEVRKKAAPELAKFAQEQNQVLNNLINYTEDSAEEINKIVTEFCNKIQNESMSATEAIEGFTLAIQEYGKAAGILKNNDNIISAPTIETVSTNEPEVKLFTKPKNNQEKLFNTLATGENAFKSKSKGDISGFNLADRETIAEAIVQGLQQGLNEINIVVNNGKTTLTLAGGVKAAAEILNSLGFQAIESEITKFVQHAFNKKDIKGYFANSENGHYISDNYQMYRISRPLNEMESKIFSTFTENQSLLDVLNGGKYATATLPNNVREVSIDIPGGKKGGEKHYIFKTEDGQYLVVRKSYLDNIRKVSSVIKYIPNQTKNGRNISPLYGFDKNNNVVAATTPVRTQESPEKLFNSALPTSKRFSVINDKPLNIAGTDVIIEKKKQIQAFSEATKQAQQQADAEERVAQAAENAESENAKLTSSYKGLADAVERYVESSKKLWAAYDNGEDFSKFAEERNAAIEKIASLFPADDISGIPASLSQSGYKIALQSKEMSSQFAKDGAEATLKAIETNLGQAAEEVRLAEEAKRIEEERLAEEAKAKQIADETAETKRKQAEAAKEAARQAQAQAEAEKAAAEAASKTVKSLNDANSTIDASAEELIARDVNEALKQLRSAKNNETTLFTLKGVFEGEDLVEQAQEMVKNIAKQANLTLGKFNVKDDVIKVQLYNEELKVTVDQMYKLRAATEEVESAQLELVSQSFSQNVKALNENTFDVEGVQQRALASIEKVRSSLHGLEYDLTDLENIAKNISSQDDFNKFNNQLKAAQDNIQAIKNSTVSKNSMNPLANMQRDMQNANIEIETMRIKLEKFGNIDGVTKAKQMLEEMTSAAQQFNSAQDAQGQQSAYNQYSNLRSQFKAQTEYINAVKQLKDSQVSAAKQTDPIREQYKSLLDIINKINSVNSNILKYQGKDGGSGLFSGYISQLQSDKQKLVSELQSITQEINNALSGGFVQGKEFSIPFTNILSDDGGAVSSFLNDTKTQAALTTEEIEKLVAALQKTQNIDVEAAARVTEQFKSVQKTYKQITSLTTLDKNGSLYKGVENVFAQIMQYKDTLSSDPTQWTPEQSANLQVLIDKFNEYGNVLVQVGQKEAQYFAGKTKYAQDTTMDNMIQNETEKAKKLTDVQKQLEEAARSFAQKSGAENAFVTNFTQSADGIAKLDFSIFDTATNSLRNFRMEMGSVSEGMYVTETTVNKALANIQAAQKQIQSMSDLVVRLGQSGVDINSDTATGQVSKLLQLLQQLRAETAKGDGADQSILSKLTKDAKLSCAEVEKLYKQLIQMQNSINSGEAKSLGVVDLNGDKYSQMAEKIKEFAATFPDAALNIGKLNEETGKLPFTITSAGGEMTSFEAKVNSLNGQMILQKKGVQQLGSSWDQFKNSLSKTGKQLMTALVGYNVFFKAISEIRKGINYVKEIDLAMTELKKVTDETEASYDRFLKTASKTAGAIGSTVSDFTEATANFARLGYTMEESADMAETAIVYKNVADGLDTVEESTESIISTMKAFGIESDDTMGIIDRFNEVGNNFAITSAGIGEALQRSASALYEAGNTIDESIGLVTAANSVIQNPEQVGTALKTLALRLRGTKTELEEAGEDVDGMAESTSQLQAKLKALTHGKVDIMVDENNFKNTTEILREMSAAWEDMTDIERASALELMGGKRQANILSSIIKNFDTVEDVIETSMNSQGSALKENEKYLDSVQGRIDILTNSMQTLWNNTLNSDVLKFFLDIANAIVKVIDKVGLLGTAISAILAKNAFSKKSNFGNIFQFDQAGFKGGKTFSQSFGLNEKSFGGKLLKGIGSGFKEYIANLKNTEVAAAGAQASVNALAGSEEAQGNASLFAAIKSKLAAAGITSIGAASAIAAVGVQVLNAALTMGIGVLVSAVMQGIMSLINKVAQSSENLKQEVTELTDAYETAKKSFSDNLDTLTTPSDTAAYKDLEEEFSKLTKGVDAYGNNISLTSDQYERYREICETICDLNPSLIDGYDSATEAIGRNASALSNLIEQQKRQARQEAQEYTKDENIKKISKNAINDYKDAQKEYYKAYGLNKKGKVKAKEGSLLSALESQIDDGDWEDVAVATMKQLGYETDKIKEVLQQYYVDSEFDTGMWFTDYADLIVDNSTLFNEEVQEASANLTNAKNTLETSKDGIIDTLLEIPSAMSQYDELGSSEKSFITEWIKTSGKFKIDDEVTAKKTLEWKNEIRNMVLALSNDDYSIKSGEMKGTTAQDILDSIFNLNPSTVNWASYKQQMSELIDYLWQAIGGENNALGFENKQALALTLGVEIDIDGSDGDLDESKKQEIVKKLSKYYDMTEEAAQRWLDSQPAVKVQAWMETDWNLINSKSEMDEIIKPESSSESLVNTKTYSVLIDQVNSYNEVLKESSDILMEGTETSEDYYNSLKELGISEEDLGDCIDTANGYMVTNVKKLKDLIKSSNKNIVSNTKLAKSQARLKYYELFKEMSGYINAEGKIVKGSAQQILALYNEMNALEKTIAKYSMLEVQLLGTTNAYEKFKQAQEADSETDYISNAEEMVQALGEAFNTAELGTESAQAAIAGLVPESVYEDLDTVDEKMSAIYDYFKKGKITQYFSLEFDDDGSITSAEMKLGNLRKFIEDGLANGVFTGNDWQHFDLSKEFDDLEEGADKLQYLADKMNVTKDVAFAFFKALEDHDIEWLNGDYTSMLEDLLPESFERDIYNAMQDIADLNAKLADGSISAKEYAKQFSSLSIELEAAKKASRENMFGSDGVADKNTQQVDKMDLSAVDGYFEANQKVANAQTAVTEATKKQIEAEKALSAARDDANISDSELKKLETGYSAATEEVLRCDTALQKAIEKRDQFAQPTEMEIQVALDDIEQEIANAGDKFDKAIAENFDVDENGYYTIKTDVDLTQLEAKYPGIKKYVDLLNSKTQLEAYADTGEAEASLQDVVDSINEIVESLNSIQLSLDKKSAEQLATDVRETIANLPKDAVVFVKTLFTGKKGKEEVSTDETGDVDTDELAATSSDLAATSSDAESNESIWTEIDTFFNETIPAKWTQFWDSLGGKFDEIQEQAEILKTKVAEFFTITIPEKWDGFWEAVGEKIDEIKEQAGILQEKVNDFFTNVFPEKWDEFWENVGDFLTEDAPYAIGYAAGTVKNFFTDTIPEKWDEFWGAVGEKFNEVKANAEVLKQRVIDFFTVTIPAKWSEFWTEVGVKIDELKANAEILETKVVDFFTVTIPTKWAEFWDGVGVKIDELKAQAEVLKTKITDFFTVTIPTKWTEFWTNVGTFIAETIPQGIEMIETGITTFFTVTLPAKINGLWAGITSFIAEKAKAFWSNLTSGFKAGDEGEEYGSGKGGGSGVNGTAHVHGTAHSSGNWGLPTSEHNALVGELGPEMVVDPTTGRYYTVGDNGAEMVNLKKGSIIFNHKQTEDLLKHGYVTSRGKMHADGTAHAEGNAHVTIWSEGSSKQQWEGTGYSGPYDSTYDLSDTLSNAADSLSDSADSLSDATDEFEEVFDWVEVRLNELDEILDLLDAKLENAVGYSAKNNIIDQMLGVSNTKMSNLQAGLEEYSDYAAKLLAQIPSQYQAAAQNGAIAIEEFAGEADEATLEAIKNYREWAEKVADLTQQMEELNTKISKLARQKFDNVADQYDDVVGIIENQNEKLEAQVDLMEDRGYVASKKYYEKMISNTQKQAAELVKERNELQRVLDEQVKLGNIKVNSSDWYEMVDQLYEIDAAIVECTADTESYQNAINDIYWDNFDELIDRLDYLSNETQNLIDLMENSGDLVDENGNWTDEGITSLGLYAQQMEIAEYTAKQYEQAIKDLNKDYAAGKYSEAEYTEKLNELKSAQYDAIEAYYDAQDAIVDLNKTRVDAIKDGIQKEIDAYEELIKKKKEELSAEKDLYDFQKSVSEQQKSIADIERKLAALSTDNSASAVAKKKQLEAELAEAKAELDESYYDRSIDQRQEALDKELEDFQEEKDAEIEKLDEYLENVEQVVADSLMTVQANASTVYDTLNEKADEYNLNLSNAILTPWRDGAVAVSEYQTTFDTAASSTMDQLEAMKMKWQEVIDQMTIAAGMEIKAQEAQNNRYTQAKNPAPQTVKPQTTTQKPAQTQKKTIKVGGKINAGRATIYSDCYGGGANTQYYSKDPIYVVLEERNGYLKVRHHSLKSGVTGWFKKSAVKAYAKGSKGIDEDQLALLHELGDELILHAGKNGKLEYLSKGTGVVPADLTERLMNLAMNPQEVLDRSRPQITMSPNISNNEINLNLEIGEVVHIDEVTNDTIPDLTKAIDKQLDSYMAKLNNSLKRFAR